MGLESGGKGISQENRRGGNDGKKQRTQSKNTGKEEKNY